MSTQLTQDQLKQIHLALLEIIGDIEVLSIHAYSVDNRVKLAFLNHITADLMKLENKALDQMETI